jgi:hypothetical protein
VTDHEHSSKQPRAMAGLRATVASCLLAIGLLLAVASFAGPVADAAVGGPPSAHIILVGNRSTRADLQATVIANGLTTKATFAYATSPSGPWTILASKTFEPDSQPEIFAGIVHHLAPATTYYLRIEATNSSGAVRESKIDDTVSGHSEQVEDFTTDSVTAPEVFTGYDPIELGEESQKPRLPCGRHVTSFQCKTHIETNGTATEYHIEYATSKEGAFEPFTSGSSSTISVAEDFAEPEAGLTGLAPETTYYLRVRATNEKGTVSYVEPLETITGKPSELGLSAKNVGSTSAALTASFRPDTFATEYRLEETTEPDNSGSWTAVPGGEGTVPAAAEEYRHATAQLTGLNPATTYYVRLFAKNTHGEATSQVESFETSRPPEATTFALHALRGETVRILGSVTPGGSSVNEEQAVTVGGGATGGTFTLTFEGETTEPIPYINHETEPNEESELGRVEHALEALRDIGEGNVSVSENFATSTYTVEFTGALAGRDLPEMTADASGLTPSGAVTVAAVQSAVAFDFGYRFQYLDSESFEKEGWNSPKTVTTPAVDLGAGSEETVDVGQDLTKAQPGRGYHYRLLATNNTAGDPTVDGAEQTLTVPAPIPSQEPSCTNQQFRSGLSALLPDCRAYEQVTPAEKEGAEDTFTYGGASSISGTVIGEDGDHFAFRGAGVQWGSNPDPVQSRYFFTRVPGEGWEMTSARPAGETGPFSYQPRLYSPDLTQVGLEVDWGTTSFTDSREVRFEFGPPGGPYTTVASVPRRDLPVVEDGWAGASSDLGTLVLQNEDRALVSGHVTGTSSGNDLYEYSAGVLRQLNVGLEGKTIGTCGAQLVDGREGGESGHSSLHAVSEAGSRVFFEAVPGSDCSASMDLYMRVGGAETIPIGEYEFVEADPEGARLLIRRDGALYRYDTETRAIEPVPASESMSVPQRYSYEVAVVSTWEFGVKYQLGTGSEGQVLRYDNLEHTVECMSCASSFDPEPKLNAFLTTSALQETEVNGLPRPTFASANGDYVFFDTPAALVPQDIDGEIPPQTVHKEENSALYSRSSDVYEWRANGVDGCSHIQGCLALISSGRGGYYVELLGTDPSGDDVFFATHESLVPSDQDNAGDVYDARIGGGFPPPAARPVECEGDACSTPASAPVDVTPSSFAFTGAGNVLQPPSSKPAVKSKKPKPKKKKKGSQKKGKHAGKVVKGHGKAKKSSRRSK